MLDVIPGFWLTNVARFTRFSPQVLLLIWHALKSISLHFITPKYSFYRVLPIAFFPFLGLSEVCQMTPLRPSVLKWNFLEDIVVSLCCKWPLVWRQCCMLPSVKGMFKKKYETETWVTLRQYVSRALMLTGDSLCWCSGPSHPCCSYLLVSSFHLIPQGSINNLFACYAKTGLVLPETTAVESVQSVWLDKQANRVWSHWNTNTWTLKVSLWKYHGFLLQLDGFQHPWNTDSTTVQRKSRHTGYEE